MAEVRHDGCFFCGTRREPVLSSVQKKVIHKSGRKDIQAVAVCSTCEKIPELDMRSAPSLD